MSDHKTVIDNKINELISQYEDIAVKHKNNSLFTKFKNDDINAWVHFVNLLFPNANVDYLTKGSISKERTAK